MIHTNIIPITEPIKVVIESAVALHTHFAVAVSIPTGFNRKAFALTDVAIIKSIKGFTIPSP
jgi:hypothetical protein